MSAFDVLIVGSGIAGASLAAMLASTHRVAILEQESAPGYHATGRSAAIFSEIYGNAAVRALSRASRGFFYGPPPGFADAPLVRPRGTLFIAPADQRAALSAMAADADVAAGTHPMTPAEVLARVPILRPEAVAAALYEPGAADIDVNALHQGFLGLARAAGARLVLDAGATAIARAGGAWQVTTPAGAFAAPVLVNAAGAWADRVASLAGARPLGIAPKRRTVVTFDPPPGVAIGDWPLTIDAEETFYFKPDAGRLLLTPADETPSEPCDAQPEEYDIAVAVARFETLTTARVGRIAAKWAGLRSFAPDRTPVCGFDPSTEGFFWLAGQGGYGMQTSPALARLAAALIRGEDPPADLSAAGVDGKALSPGRF